MERVYWLYILHSASIDRYYVGISHDPKQRLHYHNTAKTGWTKRGRPWRLVFKQKIGTKEAALRIERFVKAQKSQQFIQRIIQGEVVL